MPNPKKFYVVWVGRQPGVYDSWPECQKQVAGFSGAKYKAYESNEIAQMKFKLGAESHPGYQPRGSKTNQPLDTPSGVKSLSQTDIGKLSHDLLIFADGACDPNPGEAGTGLAIYRKGAVSELWFGLYEPHGTNNTAELNGVIQALMVAGEAVNRGERPALLIDSLYALNSIALWAWGWERSGWKRKNKQPIQNLELIKEAFSLYKRLRTKIELYHVKGHSDIEGNELADRMAVLARTEAATGFNRYTGDITPSVVLAEFDSDT